MNTCPSCNAPLTESQEKRGHVWVCSACGGCALTLASLRKKIVSPILTGIWRAAQERQGQFKRSCPLCNRRMIEVASGVANPPVLVDVCSPCELIWFDPQEIDKLPALPPDATEDELPPKAREALAMFEVNAIRAADDSLEQSEGQLNSIMGAFILIIRLLRYFVFHC